MVWSWENEALVSLRVGHVTRSGWAQIGDEVFVILAKGKKV